jgi:hypothetical protein
MNEGNAMNDIELPGDIPVTAQGVIRVAVTVVYLSHADKQAIADALERVYRLGVSNGRLEGAEMMGDIINRTAEKMAAKVNE